MEIILAIVLIGAVVILLPYVLAIVGAVLCLYVLGCVLFGIAKLYEMGWKKTPISIITILVLVPLSFLVVMVGAPILRQYQYEHSVEGIIKKNEATLKDLGRNLEGQIALISDIENTNKNDIQVFLKEIEEEKEKYQIRTFSSATLRVRNNLQLIRERDANLSQLTQIKRATQNGLEETIFMLRQLDGAKGMAKVMTDGKVLAASSERILEQYGPYQKAIVINPKHRDFKSTEAIWREYVVKSRSSSMTSLMPN